ncbi:cupin domain-containing protein [Sphingomonas adhaesiva]|uniref:cupin domain-containing protein n=1 Tax=Sphingomonas adhaesiva TaxID=28212 RepID=UPI002FF6B60A
MTADTSTTDAPRFQIYRAADAPDYSETSCMEMSGLTDIITDGITRAEAAGASEGNVVKLLFAMPGLSLTYAWFKSGFPLPLHSHNADCLYYIVAGTLKLGTEELSAGDGFFVGRDVPYNYKPGPQGVEVLEFRTADTFDIRFLGKTTAFWDKTVAALQAERPKWATQRPPHELVAAQ